MIDWPRPFTVVVTVLGGLSLLAAAPARADRSAALEEAPPEMQKQVPIEGFEALSKEAAFEEFIRYAYEDLVRWTEPAGKDLAFELRDFVHIPRRAFDTIQYTDIVTLVGGDTVVAARVRHRATWTDEVRVMYDPSWMTRSEYLETEQGRRLGRMSLDEVLRKGLQDEPRLEEVTDITSYEVTVSLEGKIRTYRAAVGWIDREPGSREISDAAALFWDNVTVGVAESLGETAPLGDQESLPRPEDTGRVTGGQGENVLSPKSTCYSGSGAWSGNLDWLLLHQSDNTGHSDGNHAATAEVAADCECDTGCSQSCTPSMRYQACPETGHTTGGCHRISAPDIAAVSGTVSDTRSQGAASCGGGVACAWKSCSTCLCLSPSVNISGTRSGSGISFTPSSPNGATISHSHVHLCDVCPLQDEGGSGTDPLEDPLDGGGSDGCSPNCTPIVINLGHGTIRLSGLDDPVEFDMNGDGFLETLSWTARGSDTAFLAYDRDWDGLITKGYELFGNFTPQHDPEGAPNGFKALATFDLDWLGGNEDGWMSAEDRYFGELRLWFDDNHDGVSQEHELFPLSDYGIEAIEVDPAEHRWRDRHGNEFRYSSRVRFEGGRTTRAVDVFLLSGSP